MASIFSKIIAGEIPSYKIAEDEDNFAFLDINPLKRGHVLVVPKKEVDYIFDLSDKALSSLNLFSKQIAIALKKAIPCIRIGTCVIGLEVPHAHIHLIPLDKIGDLNFLNPKISLNKIEMQAICDAIKSEL